MTTQQRLPVGSSSYIISNHPTSSSSRHQVYTVNNRPKEPFSIQVSRDGAVAITFDKGAKPVVNTSYASGHSSRHHDSSIPTTKYAKSPARSDVATIGSSTYLRVPSTHYGNGHSSDRHHSQHQQEYTSSSSSRHRSHSVSRSPQGSKQFLEVPTDYRSSKTYPRVEKRASMSNIATYGSSSNSPQKHAHFALPSSMPNPSHMRHASPPSPPQQQIQTSSHSRHRHTSSHESYFRHRPQGWFNRRGDQFIQRGVIKRQPRHLEWDIIFAKYPEPGTGWMDAEGHLLPPAGGILKHSAG